MRRHRWKLVLGLLVFFLALNLAWTLAAAGLPRLDEAARRRLGLVYLQARFSTYFDPNLPDRVHNIELAARQIDGLLLQPGQEFSFNAVVGKRTAQRGFRSAPVLVGGELVDGVGGGICQLSTTLYNAALLADLPIRERVHHSRPLGYVAPGRDATVYDGLYDLRFMNNRDEPVLLSVEIIENRLTVAVWGSSPPKHEVNVVTVDRKIVPAPVEWVHNPALAAGGFRVLQMGWDGVSVRVYKEYRGRPGRRFVSIDLYPPRPYRIELGPNTSKQDILAAVKGVAGEETPADTGSGKAGDVPAGDVPAERGPGAVPLSPPAQSGADVEVESDFGEFPPFP